MPQLPKQLISYPPSRVQTATNAKGNPDPVVALYAPNAILLPTVSRKVYSNSLDAQFPIKDYFTDFTALTGLSGVTDKIIIRIFGNVAIASGLYTFSYQENGEIITVPARFTFAFKNIGGKWMIIEHHSSKLP